MEIVRKGWDHMDNVSLSVAKHESLLKLWRQRILECRNSGLTVATWCEQNQVGIKSYYYWLKRVWDRETNSMIPDDRVEAPATPQFAQVHLTDCSGSTIDADLVIRHDSWTLEVKNSASPALLAQILQMVMRSV